MFCSKCGNECHNEAVVCPGCGCSTGAVVEKETNDVLFAVPVIGWILGWYIPLVAFGAGIYLFYKKQGGHGIALTVWGLFWFFVWTGVVSGTYYY